MNSMKRTVTSATRVVRRLVAPVALAVAVAGLVATSALAVTVHWTADYRFAGAGGVALYVV